MLRIVLILTGLSLAINDLSAWTMKKAPLVTRWSATFDTAKVWPIYPRPQMKRPENTWKSLNGIWQFQKSTGATETPPTGNLTGDICVPFPIESAISGIMENKVFYSWYRKPISIPVAWRDTSKYHVLIHFEGVDWQTEFYVNGTKLATHKGGYDRFSYDITKNLILTGNADQTLLLHIYDPSETSSDVFPGGKQRTDALFRIFYTCTTGIWRSVWLEAVPAKASINRLKITPDIDNKQVLVTASITGSTMGLKLIGVAKNGTRQMFGIDTANATDTLKIPLSALNLWWPDRPYLYKLAVYILNGTTIVDSVDSYFGMRKVEATAFNGNKRLTINGQPIFLFGTLDQGFWPDGIYLPPSEEGLKYDLVMHKNYGMNGIRKHVKVEPELWYYYCDSLGLMVEQDMPMMPGGSPNVAAKANFDRDFDSLLVQHYNHPSIVMWICYNEGSGQGDSTMTTAVTKHVKAMDPSRLVVSASGWNFFPVGDVNDFHHYALDPTVNSIYRRAYINQLGEYGGMRLNNAQLDVHEWKDTASWGYNEKTNILAYETGWNTYCQAIAKAKTDSGLAGAIYTQLSDVETECNGLMTYDREVSKGRATEIAKGSALLVDHPVAAALVDATLPVPDWNSVGVKPILLKSGTSLSISRISASGNGITIQFKGLDEKGNATLKVVNAKGSTVFSTVVGVRKSLEVPGSAMAKGVYLFELEYGKFHQSLRFVVK